MMKTLTIAIKDMTRSSRSAFALVFMFVVPLLLTGMIYLMFGKSAAPDANAAASPTMVKVAVANLDRGDPTLAEILANFPGGADLHSLGDVMVQSLQNPALVGMLQVSPAADAASARQAVQSGAAGAAIIIPAGFSASVADMQSQAAVELYQDPGSPQAAGIVRAVLGQLLDLMAGGKIAASVALASAGANIDPAEIGAAAQNFAAAAAMQDTASALLELRSPSGVPAPATPANPMGAMVAQIMGGMMIFFAFFTGGSSCESILREDEAGTLSRLFTTPTRRSSILGGKFLAVGLTVLVQVSLLMVAGSLIFRIRWGELLPVALNALGIVTCASAFGIFVTSLLKSTRQGGVVYGGLITITGMVGLMTVFTGGGPGGLMSTLALLVPQGWAVRGLLLVQHGAALGDVTLNLLVLLILSLVFFTIGVLRFQKRYA